MCGEVYNSAAALRAHERSTGGYIAVMAEYIVITPGVRKTTVLSVLCRGTKTKHMKILEKCFTAQNVHQKGKTA